MYKLKTKEDFTELQWKIIDSDMSLEELIFGRLDMGYEDLFYDLHYRLEENKHKFEDL